MKVLIGFTLALLLIVQVSSQQRSLSCFDCVDCSQVNQQTTARRDCYGPAPTPTRQTNPTTISLTPSTTTPGTAGNINNENLPNTFQEDNSEDISAARFAPIFSCFTITAEVGDRSITSRGCAVIHGKKEDTCRSENQGEDPRFCQLCDEDNCNTVAGVGRLLTSMSLLLGLILISLRLA